VKNEINISEELKEISPLLAGLSRPDDLFKVPDGYFDRLPSMIMNRIELNAISPLLNTINKQPVFTVPAGYFENFPLGLLARLKAEATDDVAEETELISPLLGSLEKTTPFSTPPGYFDELADNLAGGMKALSIVNDELENLSALMAGGKNKNAYTVPAGYFDGLAASILARAKQQSKPAKLVSFSLRNPWLKYAAAALLTGVLVTIGFFTFNPRHANSPDPLAALSKVSDQEMVNYLEYQYIPSVDSTNTNTAALDWSDNDIKDIFQDIPDAELQHYSNEINASKDVITN
jgi:hypothetical protein